MVTGNSGENRSRERGQNRGSNAGRKDFQSDRQNGMRNGGRSSDNRGTYKSNGASGGKTRSSYDKSRSDGRTGYSKDGRGSGYGKDNRGPGYNKDNKGPRKSFGGNRGYNPYDKDRNEDKREIRSKSSGGSRDKVKEAQPDKIEIINRIEKEKKAMQKKQAERKNKNANKANRSVMRPKRTGNIDWTKAYENDEYDDDDFDMYL